MGPLPLILFPLITKSHRFRIKLLLDHLLRHIFYRLIKKINNPFFRHLKVMGYPLRTRSQNTTTTTSTTYKCDACHAILMTKKALENHKTFHCQAEEPDPENTCPTCRKTFSNNRNLRDHVKRMHPPEDGPFFDCNKCHYRSRIKAYFRDHVRRVHDKRGF